MILSRAHCRNELLRMSRVDFGAKNWPRLCSSHIIDDKKLVSDSDQFGTIGTSYDEKFVNDFVLEEDDNDELDRHDAKRADIYRPGKEDFLNKINYLIHKKKDLKAALEVYETEMKDEYVQPLQSHYRILIHACAKAGHTKKAFILYKQFKDRNMPFHIGILVDLFSACTNCHDRRFGLHKATTLLNELREKHVPITKVLYNSMIQAFGRCGDLSTAFNLVDEMKQSKNRLTVETYSFLLQGCISDKENGFRHALIVWRNMRRKRIRPNSYTYNLLLRCTKECGVGNPELLQDILLESVSKKERQLLEARKSGTFAALIGTGNNTDTQFMEKKWWEVDIKQMEKFEQRGHDLPCLLDENPELSHIVKIDVKETPESRMMLLGSVDQLILCMNHDNVIPDIKTLSIILSINNSREVETQILNTIRQLKIKADTAFFNQVIMSRAIRKDFDLGISSLEEMTEFGLSPDIITFGTLAKCCNTRISGLKLLKDIHQFGSKPNREIMTCLMRGAASRYSAADVKLYLEICENLEVSVNKKFLDMVEHFYQKYRSHIKAKETNDTRVPYGVFLDMRNGSKDFSEFANFYRGWLSRINFEGEEDPTAQYKTSKDKLRQEQKLIKHADKDLNKNDHTIAEDDYRNDQYRHGPRTGKDHYQNDHYNMSKDQYRHDNAEHYKIRNNQHRIGDDHTVKDQYRNYNNHYKTSEDQDGNDHHRKRKNKNKDKYRIQPQSS